MRRWAIAVVAGVAFGLVAGGSVAYGQGIFKIPFKFEAAGKKFSAGEYWVAQKGEGQIAIRREPAGEEIMIPFKERLAQPSPPHPEPQLVFDAVGNFEPSYTEYMTDYVLAEVWLTGGGGFLIHTTKGAHQNQVVKGLKATE